jgi:hypothetical protein
MAQTTETINPGPAASQTTDASPVYTTLPRGPGGFVRWASDYLVQIHRIGDGVIASSWGYTVWHDGRCVAGRCNGHWTAYAACKEADRALAAQVARDGEIAVN